MKTIAVFASGNGSNFEALAAACADGRIAARIALMVCDKPGAFVNERAARYGIPTFTFNPKEYPSKADYEREIVRRLRAERVELICLAGYMRILSDVLNSLPVQKRTRRSARWEAMPTASPGKLQDQHQIEGA